MGSSSEDARKCKGLMLGVRVSVGVPKVTCQEAMSCEMLHVAKEALQFLYQEVLQQKSGKKCDIEECTIIRCLAHVTEKMIDHSDPSKQNLAQQPEVETRAPIAELAALYKLALERFRAEGDTAIVNAGPNDERMYAWIHALRCTALHPVLTYQKRVLKTVLHVDVLWQRVLLGHCICETALH